MSKTNEQAGSAALNLSEEITDLSAKIQKALLVADDGNATVDKALYETLLPKDLTLELVKKVQTHHNNLTAAVSDALGTVGAEFLKKHKKIDHVHLEKFPLVRDSLRSNYARTANVGGIGGKSVEHHGYLTTKYTSGSAGTTGAAFKRIRDHHAAIGAELFK